MMLKEYSMIISFDLFDYIYPVYSLSKDGSELTFLGSAFSISSDGLVATCAHVLSSRDENTDLYINMGCDKDLHKLKIIKIYQHKSMDFAVAKVESEGQSKFLKPYEGSIKIALDVMSYGFMHPEKKGQNVILRPRFLKGYVTRVSPQPPVFQLANSTCELSFPSFSGFSGAAVFVKNDRGDGLEVAGILYGNFESSVVVHSYEERNEDGSQSFEKINRVVELGLMHTISDIKNFLDDLGINAFK